MWVVLLRVLCKDQLQIHLKILHTTFRESQHTIISIFLFLRNPEVILFNSAYQNIFHRSLWRPGFRNAKDSEKSWILVLELPFIAHTVFTCQIITLCCSFLISDMRLCQRLRLDRERYTISQGLFQNMDSIRPSFWSLRLTFNALSSWLIVPVLKTFYQHYSFFI